jgi:hypothetical protein
MGTMFPLVAEIFVRIPGTGASVNLWGVIVAAVLPALIVLMFVAVLATVAARSRRDDNR